MRVTKKYLHSIRIYIFLFNVYCSRLSPSKLSNTYHQRVLNDLYWTMISRRRILLSLYVVSKLSLFHCLYMCVAGYWRERGGRGVGMSQIIRRRESLVIYKSFNTLCIPHTYLCRPHPPPKKYPTKTILAVQGVMATIRRGSNFQWI